MARSATFRYNLRRKKRFSRRQIELALSLLAAEGPPLHRAVHRPKVIADHEQTRREFMKSVLPFRERPRVVFQGAMQEPVCSHDLFRVEPRILSEIRKP